MDIGVKDMWSDSTYIDAHILLRGGYEGSKSLDVS